MRKLYTKKDFNIAFALTSILIVLYLAAYTGMAVTNSDDLAQFVIQYDLVYILSILGIMLSPILIIMGSYMCIERFVYVKLRSRGNPIDKKGRLLIYLSIVASICFGYGFVDSMKYMIGYNIFCWILLEGYYHYVAILAAITICWLLGFIWSILQMWKIDSLGEEKSGRKKGWAAVVAIVLLFAVLVFVTRTSHKYVAGPVVERDKMRYYERYGEDAIPYEVLH